MKNLKIALAIIVAALILIVTTGVFAYNGTDVDTKYEITMPAVLTDGKGTVTSSKSGSFKYQFVETTAEKYSTLKKLDAQLNLIKAFMAGEYKNWEDATANANYKTLVTKYESTYNESVASLYTKHGSFDENAISDVRSLWIHELPTYVSDKWVTVTNQEISLDLSTFTGKKYYVAWVQLGDMYDAEVYIVNGTKKEDSDNDNNTNNNNNNNNENKNENNNEVVDKKDESTNNNSNSSNEKDTSKSSDQTISTAKSLPHTGIVENILLYVGIAASTILAIVSYRKFRNIK